MREIKFRAWDKKRKKFFFDGDIFNNTEHQSNYGCKITNFGILWTKPLNKDIDNVITDENGVEGYTDWEYDLIYSNCIVEQYTGLKDKNGKEIYEGGIVVAEKTKCIVKFDIEDGLVAAYPIADNAPFVSSWGWNEMEVIGNIHENPEILKYYL